MAADIQYPDALKALDHIESAFLPPGKFTTYGEVCEALGYKPPTHARHVGQVCSLIDSTCFWAKLPFLSAEKVRSENGQHNLASFSGNWESFKDTLIKISASHEWTSKDIGVIRAMLNHMNGEGALSQWERIEGFGRKAQERALTHL